VAKWWHMGRERNRWILMVIWIASRQGYG